MRRRPRPSCATPGCTNEAVYATVLRAPGEVRKPVLCAGCAWGIARWIGAVWKVARLEAVPL